MQVSRYFQSYDSEMYSQCDLKMEKVQFIKKNGQKSFLIFFSYWEKITEIALFFVEF